jgi:hypothetical protein
VDLNKCSVCGAQGGNPEGTEIVHKFQVDLTATKGSNQLYGGRGVHSEGQRQFPEDLLLREQSMQRPAYP